MPGLDLLPEDDLQVCGVVGFQEGVDGGGDGVEHFGGELGSAGWGSAGGGVGGMWGDGGEEAYGADVIEVWG